VHRAWPDGLATGRVESGAVKLTKFLDSALVSAKNSPISMTASAPTTTVCAACASAVVSAELVLVVELGLVLGIISPGAAAT